MFRKLYFGNNPKGLDEFMIVLGQVVKNIVLMLINWPYILRLKSCDFKITFFDLLKIKYSYLFGVR